MGLHMVIKEIAVKDIMTKTNLPFQTVSGLDAHIGDVSKRTIR